MFALLLLTYLAAIVRNLKIRYSSCLSISKNMLFRTIDIIETTYEYIRNTKPHGSTNMCLVIETYKALRHLSKVANSKGYTIDEDTYKHNKQ